MIDLIGYRRYGHNGHDQPAMTQPAMQRCIQAHRSVIDLYGEKLVRHGAMMAEDIPRARSGAWAALEAGDTASKEPPRAHAEQKESARNTPLNTAVPLGHLQSLLHKLGSAPPDIVLHPAIDKLLKEDEQRRAERERQPPFAAHRPGQEGQHGGDRAQHGPAVEGVSEGRGGERQHRGGRFAASTSVPCPKPRPLL